MDSLEDRHAVHRDAGDPASVGPGRFTDVFFDVDVLELFEAVGVLDETDRHEVADAARGGVLEQSDIALPV